MSAIKEARVRAGLSQAELARLSGVARPNIAAYETGGRQPSPEMLRRLVDAARPKPSSQLEKNRDAIRALASTYGMGSTKVFGSVARGTDTPESDLDLLVDPEPGTGLFALSRFARAVEETLGVQVDVVTVGGLRTQHADIQRDAVPV